MPPISAEDVWLLPPAAVVSFAWSCRVYIDKQKFGKLPQIDYL